MNEINKMSYNLFVFNFTLFVFILRFEANHSQMQRRNSIKLKIDNFFLCNTTNNDALCLILLIFFRNHQQLYLKTKIELENLVTEKIEL